MSCASAVRFSLDDAQRAADEWGANCGPGAIAAVCGLTLDEVRPHLGDFERKRYTNPKLMFDTLDRLGVAYERVPTIPVPRSRPPQHIWPSLGLVRVQWEGPWTEPGVPIRARYRHTHWIGARHNTSAVEVFDINAICVGGWISFEEWSTQLVPWLLCECQPQANGRWHQTHVIEVSAEPPLERCALREPGATRTPGGGLRAGGSA